MSRRRIAHASLSTAVLLLGVFVFGGVILNDSLTP